MATKTKNGVKWCRKIGVRLKKLAIRNQKNLGKSRVSSSAKNPLGIPITYIRQQTIF